MHRSGLVFARVHILAASERATACRQIRVSASRKVAREGGALSRRAPVAKRIGHQRHPYRAIFLRLPGIWFPSVSVLRPGGRVYAPHAPYLDTVVPRHDGSMH